MITILSGFELEIEISAFGIRGEEEWRRPRTGGFQTDRDRQSCIGRIGTSPDVGLLAQAKLGRRLDGSKTQYKWDGLTRRQVKLFPYRRDYSSLMLYRVDGQKQNELEHFGWHLCKGYKPSDAPAWLDTDSFPKEMSSSEIIRGLFNRAI